MARKEKPKRMSEGQIMKMLAEKHIVPLGIKVGAAQTCVRELFDTVTETALQEAEAGFKVPGIGMLIKVHRPQRQGRDPKTGEEKTFPAKTQLKFRILGSLKKRVLG